MKNINIAKEKYDHQANLGSFYQYTTHYNWRRSSECWKVKNHFPNTNARAIANCWDGLINFRSCIYLDFPSQMNGNICKDMSYWNCDATEEQNDSSKKKCWIVMRLHGRPIFYFLLDLSFIILHYKWTYNEKWTQISLVHFECSWH